MLLNTGTLCNIRLQIKHLLHKCALLLSYIFADVKLSQMLFKGTLVYTFYISLHCHAVNQFGVMLLVAGFARFLFIKTTFSACIDVMIDLIISSNYNS